MRQQSVIVAVLSLPWCLLTLAASEAHIPKPNILVVVSDNQGWKDIGYHGSEIRTPVLDQLANAGVRLERPMLNGTGDVAETVLYWKSYNGQRAAVRHGNWKLHVDYRTGHNRLFNMLDDPYEKQNLALREPGRVSQLAALLEEQAKLDQ